MERNNRKREDARPNMYSIFKGKVASVQNYGVFVSIPDSRNQGLVHISQMSSSKVENAADMVSVGETVWCKVISIDDSGKIGLSMKVVNQTTGSDQDPNHIQSSLDEQKRKSGHKRGHDKIELGAVYDTTCTKCGGKGHIARDCFHVPGGKSYDLLPDVDYLPVDEGDGQQTPKKKHKKEKHKKHSKKDHSRDSDERTKKTKKSLKRKSRSSHSESDSDDHRSHKKKKKKDNKKHKQKH